MDESFSEFQEKRKCNTGPKNTQKAKAKGVKRKPLKKSKTQKDIRGFVKCKENELVSYSKNFSEVCKNSGLDVDSEQLQLAIALSKSVQQSDSSADCHNSQEEKSLSSQERIAKIKLTLQEYGFKVPSTKINRNKRRNLKRQYKLLLIPDEDKKQLITDKYLKILETDPYKSLEDSCVEYNCKQSELYYKATNVPFENIKNNEIFYVNNLNFKISNNINLLREWSEIPGRPLSPSFKVDNFKFNITNLNQEELDLFLSGALRNIQCIKSKSTVQIKKTEEIMGVENIEICLDDDVEVENITEKSHTFSNSNLKNISNSNKLSSVPSMVSVQRSVSPDLFEDDITILDLTISTKTKEITFDRKDNQTCFMDLTECVVINICQDNVTKRKSNDLMDITECVTSSKQMYIEKIDLTQEVVPSESNKEEILSKKVNIKTMDLTQSSNSDGETENLEPKKNESSDDTIIINGNQTLHENADNKIANQSVNISIELQNENSLLNKTEPSETVLKETESVNTIDNIYCRPTYTDHVFDHSYIYDYDNFDDNSQEIGANNSSSDESNHVTNTSTRGCLHNTVNSDVICISDKNANQGKIITENDNLSIINDNELSGNFSEMHTNIQISDCNRDKKSEVSNISKEIDTDKNKDESEAIHNDSNNLLNKVDENAKGGDEAQLEDYNDYVFEHSYVYDNDGGGYSPIDKSNDDNENEIDLTQTSDVDSMENKNNLGKIDNISVDYDDIFIGENMNTHNISKSSIVHDKETSNCSKNLEVFEVSDKEFNYSLHKSRFDNFDADGFDGIHKESARKSRTLNRSVSENDLNTIDDCINLNYQQKSSHITTPVKALSQDVRSAIMQTPSNDYIIKTRDVTPMADYASMLSPERNVELKRYGLKPFKRKRAIQLLTYLYNQTHPVVESHDLEETSSPAKRLKYDAPVKKSPKKSSNISQSSKSPIKSCNLENISENENSLYIETESLPDIKEINCDAEDWVFQTREKSKVHSCRVPLHVAFHNYVSSRRYLRESILRYEPVNIDVIHKDLILIGYRYNPKDLLKFMDKKCITVKTTDNNARNRK